MADEIRDLTGQPQQPAGVQSVPTIIGEKGNPDKLWMDAFYKYNDARNEYGPYKTAKTNWQDSSNDYRMAFQASNMSTEAAFCATFSGMEFFKAKNKFYKDMLLAEEIFKTTPEGRLLFNNERLLFQKKEEAALSINSPDSSSSTQSEAIAQQKPADLIQETKNLIESVRIGIPSFVTANMARIFRGNGISEEDISRLSPRDLIDKLIEKQGTSI